jgi:hypothetical protein
MNGVPHLVFWCSGPVVTEAGALIKGLGSKVERF